MTTTLEFWFEFASTYSYLAAEEIDAKAQNAGVTIAWRPFLLGPIFARQGWSDSPFNLFPAKGAYMWRDMERLCRDRGLPWRRPSRFPRSGLLAARIAIALDDEARARFAKAVYRANFVADEEIADASVLASILRSQNLDPEVQFARAAEEDVKRRLREQTEAGARRGVFGAPSFLVGDELFWGGDRLEQALAWALSANS